MGQSDHDLATPEVDARLASLRDGINGLTLWGLELLKDAERIAYHLRGWGDPRQAEYEAALADTPIPDAAVRDLVDDWPITLRKLRDDLRAWWESWNKTNDALDAAQDIVDKPGSHPAERWSLGLRQHLNDIADWLWNTRPLTVANRRQDVKLPVFVQLVQGCAVPDGWEGKLRRLSDFDGYVQAFQNNRGIRPEKHASPTAGKITTVAPVVDPVANSATTVIPREYRSRRMSFCEAGIIYRRGVGLSKITRKKAGAYMAKVVRDCAEDGRTMCERGEKNHVFDLRLFVESEREKIRLNAP